MEVEKLEEGQHISCMYMFRNGWGTINGIVRKVTPKTFTVDTRTKLKTIKKANVMTLKLFDGEQIK